MKVCIANLYSDNLPSGVLYESFMVESNLKKYLVEELGYVEISPGIFEKETSEGNKLKAVIERIRVQDPYLYYSL